jgi:hypothetical protein
MATKFTVRTSNASVDSVNYQLTGFAFTDVTDKAVVAAHIIGYFRDVASADFFGGGTTLDGIIQRDDSGPGGLEMPFPRAEYAALVTAAAARGVTIAPALDWGFNLGAGNLCPLGTSVSVSELTAAAGKSGRGRHYLPFTGDLILGADGRVALSRLNNVRDSYGSFLLGSSERYISSGGAPLKPVVVGKLGENLITLVKAQPVCSNLESRRR